MKRTNYLISFVGLAASLVFALSARAESSHRGCANKDVVVTGTADSTLDIPAVQAAVDQGGRVCLQGDFSFELNPTHDRTIRVKGDVVISGAVDDEEKMATIVGGSTPFSVEALGSSVTIQGLRFDRTVRSAVTVRAAAGLIIANCVIGHVQPTLTEAGGPITKVNTGILVFPLGAPPENVSGKVSIIDNKIDLGGTDIDRGLGITIQNSGKSPGQEVDIHVSGNQVRNTVGMGIDIRDIGGRAEIDGNAITTGAIGGLGGGPSALVGGIRCLGTGSYTIMHNTVDSAFGNAAGIRVQSRDGSRPLTHAVVFDNDITMSAAVGTVFGTESTAIEIRGAANDNVVVHNSIHGIARFALSVVPESPEIPSNNVFLMNEERDFVPSIADVFVGQGVKSTSIIGPQLTIVNLGVGTVFVPDSHSHE
jgi:hypothetical protein